MTSQAYSLGFDWKGEQNMVSNNGYIISTSTSTFLIRSSNFLLLASTFVHPMLIVWSMLLMCLVFCVVFFVLFVSVLYLVYPMLSMSLDLPFVIEPSVFSDVYLFCLSPSSVICTQCCPCNWIVHSWLTLRFSLNVYLFCLSSSCILCTQCCPCHRIIHSWLSLRFSLTFIKYISINALDTR